MIKDTSMQAWRNLNDSRAISVRQAQVLAAIRNAKFPVTDAEISKLVELPINCVTGRRGELVALGLVVDCGVVKNEFGRSVHVWRVAGRLPGQMELSL
ncbi:MAG: hypothetical protein SFW66_09040 [Gammaproteobacteria bacterium]|nr:hypothetical protein [Gammaproteobacteria bacterium]